MNPLFNDKIQVAEAGSWKDGVRTSTEYFIRRPDDDISIAADIIDPITEQPSEEVAQRLVTLWNEFVGIPDPAEALREARDSLQTALDFLEDYDGFTAKDHVKSALAKLTPQKI